MKRLQALHEAASRRIGYLFLLVLLPMQTARAESITFEAYMDRLLNVHPRFQKEQLSPRIAAAAQDALAGDADWTFRAAPSMAYEDAVEVGLGAPEEVENAHVVASLSRKIWNTGGRLEVSYDYDFTDATYRDDTLELFPGESIDLAGPARFFQNKAAVSYVQPLLRNRGGQLDRLAYDLQGFSVGQAAAASLENSEAFLLDVGIRFLDWVLLTEQEQIGRERLRLAQEELDQTRRKLDAGVVEKVDVFRAQDAVLVAEQAFERIRSRGHALQAELAVLARDEALVDAQPTCDLYTVHALPEIDQAVSDLKRLSRPLAQNRLRRAQLERLQQALLSAEDVQVDLVLSGGLQDGDTEGGDAADFDRPQYGIALAMSYPLGNSKARADLEQVALEIAQVDASMQDIELELESRVRALLTQIRELVPVLKLNVEQIRTAADKTTEELRLYEQGRNQLTFVIQSRDAETVAHLRYAANAVEYQKLVLQYRALMDELLPEGPE